MKYNTGYGLLDALVIFGLITIAVALMSAVTYRTKFVEIDRSHRDYEIINIDPPKRFYIDIKDVETGETFTGLYVSKRCYSWELAKTHRHWKFYRVTYRNEKTHEVRYDIEGTETLCQKLREIEFK